MARITIGLMRELERQVTTGDISYSRMVEILNEQVKLNENLPFEYYKVKEKYIKYKGDRYFKFKWNSDKITQVCLETNNDTKRGKGHYVGIYRITRSTMFSNWYPNYVESCTEKEYNDAFNKAIKLLTNIK